MILHITEEGIEKFAKRKILAIVRLFQTLIELINKRVFNRSSINNEFDNELYKELDKRLDKEFNIGLDKVPNKVPDKELDKVLIKKSKIQDSEIEEILECIRNARKEWISACLGFEYADNKDIIDYYAYKIKAHQLQYEYFLKKAKEKGIKAVKIG